MHFFSIDDHSITCHGNYQNYFLFQYAYDFYLIIYCGCHNNVLHLDFKLSLIKSLAKKIGKPEKFNKYHRSNINKSINLKECIRERKIDYLLSRNITEVSCIYEDMTRKAYCFGVEHSFKDYLSNNINYIENYHKAIKEIELNNFLSDSIKDSLKDEMQSLVWIYNDTQYKDLTDIQKVTLTKFLSKNFIKNYAHDNQSNKL